MNPILPGEGTQKGRGRKFKAEEVTQSVEGGSDGIIFQRTKRGGVHIGSAVGREIGLLQKPAC